MHDALPPMRALLPSILAVMLGSLSGCCSLSRFFCGPDRSPWVPQSFDTPRRTTQTLFEALRRDDPEVLFLCLDPAYRRRIGIDDSMAMRLAWDRFREQNPGLHVAGYTTVPEPRLLDPDHARVTVDIVGEKTELDLRRQSVWEVRFRRPDGSVFGESAAIASFADRAQIAVLTNQDDDASRLMLTPFVFHHDGLAEVPLDAIEHVALTRRWLVADVRPHAEQP